MKMIATNSAGGAVLRAGLIIAVTFALGQTAEAAHRRSRSAHTAEHAAALTQESIENAQWSAKSSKASSGNADSVTLKAEILLDRAAFSPGEIDGHAGENFHKAVTAYQQANQINATGKLDQATWGSLAHTSSDAVTRQYTITAKDLKGPFVKDIPKQYEDMAKLDHIGYHTPAEMLAEKFHMSEDLLAALNPGKKFDQEGTQILVTNVDEMDVDVPGDSAELRTPDGKTVAAKTKAERLEVDKTARTVRVFGHDGKLIAYYPASVGSTEKPAPSGKLTVRHIDVAPTYDYNPEFAFKSQKVQHPVTVPAGPNGPVGLVWIDLSAKSYGIHGTSEPKNISKTESHGCVRLTNWDVLALSQMVKKGTPVDFVN
jgi:lipoprotein-anchoring transpeptidase ErfK/SrfK